MNKTAELPPSIHYVGFWKRVLASVIDIFLQVGLLVGIYFAIFDMDTLLAQEDKPNFPHGLIQNILPMLIILIFWVYKSATPGKMALGMIIVDRDGVSKPSTGQLIGRYFAYIISTIPLMLGFLWVAFDKEKRGFHDILAGTLVVYE